MISALALLLGLRIGMKSTNEQKANEIASVHGGENAKDRGRKNFYYAPYQAKSQPRR